MEFSPITVRARKRANASLLRVESSEWPARREKSNAAFIERYDRSGTLFYLDPPYWGSERDYGKDMFSRDDFERLSQALRGLKGRFVMSINDNPAVREMFDGFHLQPVELTYSISRAGGTKARELIISG